VFDDRMPAAGVYVSRDGGATWNAANDALSSQSNVIDLAVDPSDSQTVYAATGNSGLLKSSDGGHTWRKINQADSTAIILSVEVNPFDADNVYAGVERMGLHRSNDGGTTWQPSMDGMPPETRVGDIVFDPQNPQVVYASDHFSGVYRSDNGGDTWRPINSSLRTRAVNRLALSGDGLHLYAATEGEGVYRLDINGVPPLSQSDTRPAEGNN
jgi:photosystem II stability/assembly factor-like uncharacterized protein